MQDADFNDHLEGRIDQLQTKNTELEEVISAMREAEDQSRIERETEVDNMTKQIDSLRKRQEKSQNGQMAHLEEENRKLVKVRREERGAIKELD